MKKFKFAFASLLLAVAAMVFSAASTQAQEIKYYTFTKGVRVTNFITDRAKITTLSNWSGPSTSNPSCPTGTIYICSIKLEVTSGTLPPFGPPPAAPNNILAALDDYFNPSIGNHPFPGCDVEFSISVPLVGGGTQTVKVTFSCRQTNPEG